MIRMVNEKSLKIWKELNEILMSFNKRVKDFESHNIVLFRRFLKTLTNLKKFRALIKFKYCIFESYKALIKFLNS